MPIHQQRLIDLISAADEMNDYADQTILEATEFFRGVAQRLAREIMPRIEDNDTKVRLSSIISGLEYQGEVFRQPPTNPIRIIERERAHFKLTSRKNDRNKIYQQERRRIDGIAPRQTYKEAEAELKQEWQEVSNEPADWYKMQQQREAELGRVLTLEERKALRREEPTTPVASFTVPEGTNVPADLYHKPTEEVII